MSSTRTVDSNSPDCADWNHAFDLVSRLAAARGTTLQEESGQALSARIPSVANVPDADVRPSAIAPDRVASIAPDQLARAVAEIEKAAAALRRQEPALEQRVPEAIAPPRRSRSVWVLIASIWLSAALVVTGVVGALVLLFG